MSFVDTWSSDRRTVTSTCRACPPDHPAAEERFRASDLLFRQRWKRQHTEQRHTATSRDPQGDDAA